MTHPLQPPHLLFTALPEPNPLWIGFQTALLLFEQQSLLPCHYSVRFVGFVSGFIGATPSPGRCAYFAVHAPHFGLARFRGVGSVCVQLELSTCIGCSGRRHRQPLRRIETDGARGPGGEAVLDYAVFDAKRAGFGKFIFVIRRSIEQDFRDVFGRRFAKHIDVEYAFQELDMRATGALRPARPPETLGHRSCRLIRRSLLDRPFAVINADDFYGAESFRLLARFLMQAAPANPKVFAMVGFQLDRTLSEHGTVARGLCHADAEGF